MSIYGFQNWSTQRASPRPDEVGQLLAQRSMGGDPPLAGAEDIHADVETAGGRGNEPDPHAAAQNHEWPTAAEAALRAAILRRPGPGPMSNPKPPAPFSRQQLQRLGLPDDQITVLAQTQGANA